MILRGACYNALGSDGLPIGKDSVYFSTQCSSRQLPRSLLKNYGTIFIENQLLHVPRPPYRLDLAPSDFWLFRCIKTGLPGRSFDEPEELLEGIREFLEEILAAELTAVFEGWIDRVS
jgi:hypothetical protein